MSTTITTTTPTSSFLALPSELRLKIWSNLLPGPRTLPIRYSRIHKSYYTPVSTSVLLSISSETRTLFLEHYSLLHLNPSYNSTIYINFALDTLCFDHEECSPIGDLAMDFKNCTQKDLIERVDIDVHLWEIMRLFRFDALAEIKYLYGLRNLTFVLRKSDVEFNNGEEDEVNNTRARTRDVWGGRMLIEGQTMDREIAQCQWYVSMVKWEVEHGDHQWTNCKPNVQMCIT